MDDTTMNDDDVIVIGSGPCGAAAASRLVARGVGVTMLDAGLRAPSGVVVRAAGNTLYRRMGWKYYSTDRLGPGTPPDVDWGSSLSLGGLSNFWTAAVPRFAPEDFTEGGRLDERYVWPIAYEELVPFYELAEGMLQVTAGEAIPGVPSNLQTFQYRLPADWRGVVERATSGGHAVGVLPMAKGHPWMIALRGTEFSSYHCVVRPLLSSHRFRLVSGAQVTRIRSAGAGGHADVVEYVDRRDGTLKSVRGRAVVIAAGAIDSTTIVLRSTSPDFPHGIGNSAGLVGRYLHDHPREWWRATSDRPLPALSHPVYAARTPHGTGDPLLATSLTLGLSARSERLRTFYGGRTSTFGVQVFGTMVPTPDLGVTLASADDDPLTCLPTISLRYDQRTVDNLVTARDRLRDVFTAAGLQVDVPGPFHELRPGSSIHFGGTLRMHADPAFGVVDAWNRMHDVPNVIVCDSSCFTTGPEKNPTLTAMAIALRAADRLATDLGD
jgi:choline dehydrogenase-like flavoprotein